MADEARNVGTRTLPMDLQQPQSLTSGRHFRRSMVAACLALRGSRPSLPAELVLRPRAPSTTQRTAHPDHDAAPTGAAASALAAYRAMWADMVTASLTSDYQSPLLPEHASGEALSVLVQGLAKNQAQGIVAKGEPVLHPQITSLDAGREPDPGDHQRLLRRHATGSSTRRAADW